MVTGLPAEAALKPRLEEVWGLLCRSPPRGQRARESGEGWGALIGPGNHPAPPGTRQTGFAIQWGQCRLIRVL